MTQHRVIQILTDNFGSGKATGEILWRGEDISELSKLYPPSNVFGADELAHHEIEDGMVKYDYRFERLENGEWVECNDPRQRQSVGHSELERAIEADNRRDFPGDYADEDAEWYGTDPDQYYFGGAEDD